MKIGKFTHAIAVLLSSVSSLFAHDTDSKAEPAKTKFSKKSDRSEDRLFDVRSIAFTPSQLAGDRPEPGQRYPWKKDIVTTIFWIGEKPGGNNPVPNRVSSWDKQWAKNYGGVDDPNPSHRSNYVPVNFTPRLNPFYCALPVQRQGDVRATGPKRRVLFPGLEKRIRDRLSRLAKIDGSQFAKTIESRTRNGKTPDHSAPTTGSTFSATTGQNQT